MSHGPTAEDLVDAEILKLLGTLNDSMNILATFEEAKRQHLYGSLQTILEHFRNLRQLAPKLTGSVPLAVISLVDAGKNPGDFAAGIIEESHATARRVETKQKWMQHLKDSLDALIDLNFPDCPERLLEQGDLPEAHD
jgi:hypothetical protein